MENMSLVESIRKIIVNKNVAWIVVATFTFRDGPSSLL